MRAKIMIVDDEEDLRRILRGILEPIAQVCEAAGGEEALRLLLREKPDLMFLDVTMPGLGGLALLRRALRTAPHLAVVMLTGNLDLSVARAALEGGARAYITKPFDPGTVIAEVERLSGAASPPPGEPPWRVRGKERGPQSPPPSS
jgi:CheY-like chemotaxis protein